MHTHYLTVANAMVTTQSETMAEEVLATVKDAGYKRSEVTNFKDVYTSAYASTAPTKKRVVAVKYAPTVDGNSLISNDDIILILLASGWCMPHHSSLSTGSTILCKAIEEEVAVEVSPQVEMELEATTDLY